MDLKRVAAERAAEFLEDVKVLGLGSGSTAARFAEVIAERRAGGELADLVAVPTSLQTEELARKLGIPLSTLEEHPSVDLTVDGADEVDPNLDLIKGGGGALTREKIVASASRRVIIVVDDSKLVARLGDTWPVPVEVVRFGWRATQVHLAALCEEPFLRRDGGEHFVTDQGNLIIDCGFPSGLEDPYAFAEQVSRLPGVVEHGLFLGMAERVVVGSEEGARVLERS